jgi:hypothetical protein
MISATPPASPVTTTSASAAWIAATAITAGARVPEPAVSM